MLKVWITYRDKKNFDATGRRCQKVLTVQCEHNSNRRCVSCDTMRYNDSFTKKYNSKCPAIKKQIVVRENDRWFNGELLKAKRLRRRLEDNWRKKRTPQSRALYVRARNDYNALVERVKRDYYNNESETMNDSKKRHKRLDDLLGLKKRSYLIVLVLKILLNSSIIRLM